jgi:lysyl-tRNA synthetase class II
MIIDVLNKAEINSVKTVCGRVMLVRKLSKKLVFLTLNDGHNI